MKQKLAIVTNLAVILVVVYVGFAVLRTRYAAPDASRYSPRQGEVLIPPPGISWNEHPETLVLALKKGCHYCEDSAPFYKRLLEETTKQSHSVYVVAVFPDDTGAAQQVLSTEDLKIPAVGGVPLERLQVYATPTLILLDQSGKIKAAWVGMLSPKKELEVIGSLNTAVSPNVGGY